MGDLADGWGEGETGLGVGGHRISDDEHEDKAFMTFRRVLKG